jgi:hypothetical protein
VRQSNPGVTLAENMLEFTRLGTKPGGNHRCPHGESTASPPSLTCYKPPFLYLWRIVVLSTLVTIQCPAITKSALSHSAGSQPGHATQLLFLIHVRCLIRGWWLGSIQRAVGMVGGRDMEVVDVVGGGLRRVVGGIRGQCCCTI